MRVRGGGEWCNVVKRLRVEFFLRKCLGVLFLGFVAEDKD